MRSAASTTNSLATKSGSRSVKRCLTVEPSGNKSATQFRSRRTSSRSSPSGRGMLWSRWRPLMLKKSLLKEGRSDLSQLLLQYLVLELSRRLLLVLLPAPPLVELSFLVRLATALAGKWGPGPGSWCRSRATWCRGRGTGLAGLSTNSRRRKLWTWRSCPRMPKKSVVLRRKQSPGRNARYLVWAPLLLRYLHWALLLLHLWLLPLVLDLWWLVTSPRNLASRLVFTMLSRVRMSSRPSSTSPQLRSRKTPSANKSQLNAAPLPNSAIRSRSKNARRCQWRRATRCRTPSAGRFLKKSATKSRINAASLSPTKCARSSRKRSAGRSLQRGAGRSLYRSATKCPKRDAGRSHTSHAETSQGISATTKL